MDEAYTVALLSDPHTQVPGSEFAGLINGARLKEAGVSDVRIIEKGGDFGGAWYWNRFPGAGRYYSVPVPEDSAWDFKADWQ